MPNCTKGPTLCAWNSNAVTTPKLPPPPRIAQKRSACSSGAARRISPSAVTTSADSRLSTVSPCLRVSQPMPPPKVRAADPGVTDHTCWHREPMSLCRRIHVRQSGAPADADPCILRVDAYMTNLAEVDHQAVVANTVASGAVRATPHRDLQAPLAGELDRRAHIGGTEAPGDQVWPSADSSVHHRACAVVVSVRRADHRPIHCASKKINILLYSAGHQDLLTLQAS